MPREKISKDAEDGAATGGRRRLMQAALRIGASRRSLQSLGLRELAREAGLNPNTFYRHFDSLEQLSRELIDELSRDVRSKLRDIRRSVPHPEAEATPRTLEYMFDFALRNPEAVIVAVRELHGAMPALREALQRMIDAVTQEMVEDVQFLDLAPGLAPETLREVSRVVVQQVFHAQLDYIEQPIRRSQILRETIRFIDMLFAGAMTLQMMKVETLAELVERQKIKG